MRVGRDLLEQMTFAGAARTEFDDVVIALDERDHAQEGDIARARRHGFGFEADAAEQEILPLFGAQLCSALADPDSGLFIAPVAGNIADALQNIPRDAVPDMPDRIIAATDLHLGLPLVTRDRRLQAAGIQTIW